MPVEARGGFIDRIHDHGPRAELLAATNTTSKGVCQETTTGALALAASIEREPGEQDHRNRIRHATAETGRSLGASH